MTSDPRVVSASLLAMSCAVPFEPPPEPDPIPEPTGDRRATLSHALAPIDLAGSEETIACYSWTLDNEQPLYVDAVALRNLGSFHHSNWYVVPDTVYEGPDGGWPCDERDFQPLAAALSGTVLFAQSTQAWDEETRFSEGTVIKIPARSRIVGEVHLLNLSPAPRQTQAWMSLELIHPWDVETVLVPLQLTYLDLDIPASSRARFSGLCPAVESEGVFATLPEMTVHYVLPHTHGTGELVELELGSDPANTQTWKGFSGQALGRVLDPPVALAEGDRLQFTCGYDNWHDEPLAWGIGIDEMCVVFALVDAPAVFNGVVTDSLGVTRFEDGVPVTAGPCLWAGVPRGLAYEPPRDIEHSAPLYVPPSGSEGPGVEPPTCADADPTAMPAAEGTFENVVEHVLSPWCSFSSCHGQTASAGLDFTADDLHARLVAHDVAGPTTLPLVEPGDPEGSWLYRIVSRCEPAAGTRPMPVNAPVLLDDATVAILRAWIEAGADP